MNTQIFKYFLCILCILLASYSNVSSEEVKQQDKKSKIVMVLFDISSSITNKEKAKYFNNFSEKILTKINSGDTLVIGKITRNSLNEELIKKTIMPYEYKPKDYISDFYRKLNEKKYRKKFQSLVENEKEGLEISVKELLKNSSIITDIFGSMYNADRVFRIDKKEDYDLRLVIMSDMINISKDFNFNKLKLTKREISEIISVEKKKKGALPCMDGLKVYIWGASAESSEKIKKLNHFWNEYFLSCGAQLVDFGRTPIKEF